MWNESIIEPSCGIVAFTTRSTRSVNAMSYTKHQDYLTLAMRIEGAKHDDWESLRAITSGAQQMNSMSAIVGIGGLAMSRSDHASESQLSAGSSHADAVVPFCQTNEDTGGGSVGRGQRSRTHRRCRIIVPNGDGK